MIRDEILHHLSAWQDAMREVDKQYEKMYALMGVAPESPLWKAVGDMQNLLTDQAADLCCIGADWLMAWWLEHQFGETPMKAGLHGEELREIRTLEELVALICDDTEAADAPIQT